MRCPKCNSEMEHLATAEGEVDRCRTCRGLWFAMMKHEDLKPVAKVIDDGDPELGEFMNQVEFIDYPVCPDSALIRMVDPAQPHIWFESCPTCYGRFFDAGEFRDYAELTAMDVIRRLRARERR